MSTVSRRDEIFNDDVSGSDESASEEGSDSDEGSEDESGEESGSEEDDESEENEDDISPEHEKSTHEGNVDSDENGEHESCPICLARFREQDLGTPENCAHTFCLECIVEWSKNINTCPIDRNEFHNVLLRNKPGGKIIKKVKVEVQPKEPESSLPEDVTVCEVCRRGNREDRLLLCDACDLAYHCECLDPPLFHIPIDEWFCPPCARVLRTGAMAGCSTPRSRRVIPRTRASETVRNRVQSHRKTTTNRPSTSRSPSSSRTSSKTPRRRKRRRTYRRSFKKVVKLARTKKNVMDGAKGKECVQGSTIIVTYRRKGRRKRRKSTKTKKPKVSSVQAAYIKSAQDRIAKRLGLCKSSKGGSIPDVKQKGGSSSASYDNRTSVSLFGRRDELDDFTENDDNPQPSKPSTSSSRPSSSSTRVKAVSVASTSSVNILDSILESQTILYSKPDNVVIQTDGTLAIKKSSSEGPSSNKKANENSKSTSQLSSTTYVSTAKNGAIPKCKISKSHSETQSSQNSKTNLKNFEFKRPFDISRKSISVSSKTSSKLSNQTFNSIPEAKNASSMEETSSNKQVKLSASKKALWKNSFDVREINKPSRNPSQPDSQSSQVKSTSTNSTSTAEKCSSNIGNTTPSKNELTPDFIRNKRLMFYSRDTSSDSPSLSSQNNNRQIYSDHSSSKEYNNTKKIDKDKTDSVLQEDNIDSSFSYVNNNSNRVSSDEEDYSESSQSLLDSCSTRSLENNKSDFSKPQPVINSDAMSASVTSVHTSKNESSFSEIRVKTEPLSDDESTDLSEDSCFNQFKNSDKSYLSKDLSPMKDKKQCSRRRVETGEEVVFSSNSCIKEMNPISTKSKRANCLEDSTKKDLNFEKISIKTEPLSDEDKDVNIQEIPRRYSSSSSIEELPATQPNFNIAFKDTAKSKDDNKYSSVNSNLPKNISPTSSTKERFASELLPSLSEKDIVGSKDSHKGLDNSTLEQRGSGISNNLQKSSFESDSHKSSQYIVKASQSEEDDVFVSPKPFTSEEEKLNYSLNSTENSRKINSEDQKPSPEELVSLMSNADFVKQLSPSQILALVTNLKNNLASHLSKQKHSNPKGTPSSSISESKTPSEKKKTSLKNSITNLSLTQSSQGTSCHHNKLSASTESELDNNLSVGRNKKVQNKSTDENKETDDYFDDDACSLPATQCASARQPFNSNFQNSSMAKDTSIANCDKAINNFSETNCKYKFDLDVDKESENSYAEKAHEYITNFSSSSNPSNNFSEKLSENKLKPSCSLNKSKALNDYGGNNDESPVTLSSTTDFRSMTSQKGSLEFKKPDILFNKKPKLHRKLDQYLNDSSDSGSEDIFDLPATQPVSNSQYSDALKTYESSQDLFDLPATQPFVSSSPPSNMNSLNSKFDLENKKKNHFSDSSDEDGFNFPETQPFVVNENPATTSEQVKNTDLNKNPGMALENSENTHVQSSSSESLSNEKMLELTSAQALIDDPPAKSDKCNSSTTLSNSGKNKKLTDSDKFHKPSNEAEKTCIKDQSRRKEAYKKLPSCTELETSSFSSKKDDSELPATQPAFIVNDFKNAQSENNVNNFLSSQDLNDDKEFHDLPATQCNNSSNHKEKDSSNQDTSNPASQTTEIVTEYKRNSNDSTPNLSVNISSSFQQNKPEIPSSLYSLDCNIKNSLVSPHQSDTMSSKTMSDFVNNKNTATHNSSKTNNFLNEKELDLPPTQPTRSIEKSNKNDDDFPPTQPTKSIEKSNKNDDFPSTRSKEKSNKNDDDFLPTQPTRSIEKTNKNEDDFPPTQPTKSVEKLSKNYDNSLPIRPSVFDEEQLSNDTIDLPPTQRVSFTSQQSNAFSAKNDGLNHTLPSHSRAVSKSYEAKNSLPKVNVERKQKKPVISTEILDTENLDLPATQPVTYGHSKIIDKLRNDKIESATSKNTKVEKSLDTSINQIKSNTDLKSITPKISNSEVSHSLLSSQSNKSDSSIQEELMDLPETQPVELNSNSVSMDNDNGKLMYKEADIVPSKGIHTALNPCAMDSSHQDEPFDLPETQPLELLDKPSGSKAKNNDARESIFRKSEILQNTESSLCSANFTMDSSAEDDFTDLPATQPSELISSSSDDQFENSTLNQNFKIPKVPGSRKSDFVSGTCAKEDSQIKSGIQDELLDLPETQPLELDLLKSSVNNFDSSSFKNLKEIKDSQKANVNLGSPLEENDLDDLPPTQPVVSNSDFGSKSKENDVDDLPPTQPVISNSDFGSKSKEEEKIENLEDLINQAKTAKEKKKTTEVIGIHRNLPQVIMPIPTRLIPTPKLPSKRTFPQEQFENFKVPAAPKKAFEFRNTSAENASSSSYSPISKNNSVPFPKKQVEELQTSKLDKMKKNATDCEKICNTSSKSASALENTKILDCCDAMTQNDTVPERNHSEEKGRLKSDNLSNDQGKVSSKSDECNSQFIKKVNQRSSSEESKSSSDYPYSHKLDRHSCKGNKSNPKVSGYKENEEKRKACSNTKKGKNEKDPSIRKYDYPEKSSRHSTEDLKEKNHAKKDEIKSKLNIKAAKESSESSDKSSSTMRDRSFDKDRCIEKSSSKLSEKVKEKKENSKKRESHNFSDAENYPSCDGEKISNRNICDKFSKKDKSVKDSCKRSVVSDSNKKQSKTSNEEYFSSDECKNENGKKGVQNLNKIAKKGSSLEPAQCAKNSESSKCLKQTSQNVPLKENYEERSTSNSKLLKSKKDYKNDNDKQKFQSKEKSSRESKLNKYSEIASENKSKATSDHHNSKTNQKERNRYEEKELKKDKRNRSENHCERTEKNKSRSSERKISEKSTREFDPENHSAKKRKNPDRYETENLNENKILKHIKKEQNEFSDSELKAHIKKEKYNYAYSDIEKQIKKEVFDPSDTSTSFPSVCDSSLEEFLSPSQIKKEPLDNYENDFDTLSKNYKMQDFSSAFASESNLTPDSIKSRKILSSSLELPSSDASGKLKASPSKRKRTMSDTASDSERQKKKWSDNNGADEISSKIKLLQQKFPKKGNDTDSSRKKVKPKRNVLDVLNKAADDIIKNSSYKVTHESLSINGRIEFEVVKDSPISPEPKERKIGKNEDLKEEIAEEVKKVLKPFYSVGVIDKDDYKNIMRRAVPKIFLHCNHIINPEKIKKLVLSYVTKLKNS